MSKKVMKLIDPYKGLMECKVCGSRHYALIKSRHDSEDGVTKYYRCAWQCQYGCKLDTPSQPEVEELPKSLIE